MSRLQITGELPENVPKLVLIEIANSHGIHVSSELIATTTARHRLINYLNRMVLEDLDPEKPEIIARFVNNQVDWNLSALTRSFNFIKKFMTSGKLPFSWSDIMSLEIGPQIPKRPRRLNACMLYRLCRERRLVPQLDVSLEGMKLLIELSELEISSLRRILDPEAQFELLGTKLELLNLIAQMPETRLKSRLKITRPQLAAVDKTITEPRSRAEAVYLAFNLGIDISQVDWPLTEYFCLKHKSPLYLRMKKRKSKCPELDSFSVKIRYNPIIPFDWYSPASIHNFVRLAGYEPDVVRDPEEIIQLTYLTENFYLGMAPLISNSETPIDLDEVSELEPEEVVSYGVPGSPMIVIKITELESLFKTMGNFSRPNGDYYSDTAINKLTLISSSLAPIIEEIRGFQKINDAFVSDLEAAYENEPENILLALTELLYLAMYMRGWTGEGEFPIGSAPINDYTALMVNVSQYLIEFRNKIETESSWSLVSRLPIRLYKSGKYLKTQDSETIGRRLDKVRAGDGVQACIRISSNWLASSAYFYQRCLGQIVDLDIKNMRHIA